VICGTVSIDGKEYIISDELNIAWMMDDYARSKLTVSAEEIREAVYDSIENVEYTGYTQIKDIDWGKVATLLKSK